MKLISTKINDYYDCCINQYGYETDGNVFIREPQDIQVKIHLPKTNEHLGFLSELTKEHPLLQLGDEFGCMLFYLSNKYMYN